MISVVGVKIIASIKVVIVLAGPKVKFDRIEADHDQTSVTFVAGHDIALLRIGVNINFFAAIGADRRWHWWLSPEIAIKIQQLRDYGFENRYPYQSNLFGDILARKFAKLF